MKIRYIVADTNIWLLNPRWFENYSKDDCIFVLPQVVIEELDGKKNSPGVLGLNARKSIKFIGGIAKEYENESLNKSGIVIVEDKYKFRISQTYKTGLLDLSINDNKIISVAIRIRDEEKEGYIPMEICEISQIPLKFDSSDVVVLSNDCNVRTKASLLYKDLKITSEAFDEGVVNINDYYHVERFEIEDPEIINKLYEKSLSVGDLKGIVNTSIHTPIYIGYEGQTILAKVCEDGIVKPIENNKRTSCYDIVGIKPVNDGQKQLVHMIKNNDVKIVACMGISGGGKTLISVSTALKLLDDGVYSHIRLIRPYVALGNTVGYLKGDLEDKIEPIKQVFVSIMEMVGKNMEEMEHAGLVSFAVPEFERGCTYHNTIVIIDECQNLTSMEIKSLITRCGESSKVILLGDTKQVDSLYLSEGYNGLSYVMDKLSGQSFFGGIYLDKSERANFINIVDELL